MICGKCEQYQDDGHAKGIGIGIGLSPCDRCGESKCGHLMYVKYHLGDNRCNACQAEEPHWREADREELPFPPLDSQKT